MKGVSPDRTARGSGGPAAVLAGPRSGMAGFNFPERQDPGMSAETGEPDPNAADETDDEDRRVFTRLGIMTIVWVIMLIVAGLLLLYFGPQLAEIVV